jgi:hypothetical protein
MRSYSGKIRFEVFGRDLIAFLIEILGPLNSKLLAMSTPKTIDPKSVHKDRLFDETVNHADKWHRLSLLLAPKTESYSIIFSGNIDDSWASWMKRVGGVELMDMPGNHSTCPPHSPKNSTQLRAGDQQFMFPVQNFGKKVDLFSQCRHLEIAYDSVDMADIPRVKLGTKLRPLKGVNWQMREAILLAGEGGALDHMRPITFQC